MNEHIEANYYALFLAIVLKIIIFYQWLSPKDIIKKAFPCRRRFAFG